MFQCCFLTTMCVYMYVYMYVSAYVCVYACIHKALADCLVGQVLAGSVSECNKNSDI